MKLKQTPEDFQVEELTDVTPEKAGNFAFYRLDKRGIGTQEAIQQVCHRWHIEFRRVSYGGLKDRHADTKQYLTIYHGPRRGLHHNAVELHYLGQLMQPYTSEGIRANRFRLTLRDLSVHAVRNCVLALEEVRRHGIANYFDDQRFGSVGRGNQFVARAMIDGNYEEALRLALTEPYEHDRAAQKEEKRQLRQHWGQWSTLKAQLPRGHARSLVTYLVDHPADYRGAVARQRLEAKSLYLSAFQSHLWNRILTEWLKRQCRPEQLIWVDLRLGSVPFARKLRSEQQDALNTLEIPLPSARLKLDEADPMRVLIDSVLRTEGLELRHMKLKHFREPFFSRGNRPALYNPANLDAQEGKDDRHSGKRRLTLAFDLPRGSYATMLVKRLMLGSLEPSGVVATDNAQRIHQEV
jgi:tRNA pseudouridine13 synthase